MGLKTTHRCWSGSGWCHSLHWRRGPSPAQDNGRHTRSSREPRRCNDKIKSAACKKPRKISAKYLENAALFYLQRYSATVAGVRRAMVRKIDRSVRSHGGTRDAHLPDLEMVLKKIEALGLVNDNGYATSKADALRAAGKSTRVIALKLKQKGVPDALAATHVARVKAEISDEEAARTHARKKQLGPYRTNAAASVQKRISSKRFGGDGACWVSV